MLLTGIASHGANEDLVERGLPNVEAADHDPSHQSREDGLGVGVLSSVVPYVLDQVVLRRVGTARFAVLLALLPATATVVGLVLLAQLPGPAEAVGIAAVVGAVALRSRDGDPPSGRPQPTTESNTVEDDAR